MANTEKPTGKSEQMKGNVKEVNTGKKKAINEVKSDKVKSDVGGAGTEKGKEINKVKSDVGAQKPEEQKPKKPIVKKEVEKKTEVIVHGRNVPISTKKSVGICKFIMGKKIQDAIAELEQVEKGRRAVPMKGEIPHRKGKIMSGGFPKNGAKEFIILLKSLLGNANANDIEEPIVTEAIANIGERPYGRFGRTRKKRTHVLIKSKSGEKINKKDIKKKEVKKVNSSGGKVEEKGEEKKKDKEEEKK